MSAPAVTVRVADRLLRLTNLDKVLFPQTGFVKGQVLEYYRQIAPVLLPHLAGRPLTLRRYPGGVAGPGFFAKSAPAARPDWLTVVRLPTPGSTTGRDSLEFVVVTDLAALMWAVNLAGLELHVPQWRVDAAATPDRLVLDLDPGPPATVVQCCQVALLLRDRLAADGLRCVVKTSGSKGLHLSALAIGPAKDTAGYARRLAGDLARDHPGLVVAQLARAARAGKVLLDWSQNAPAKTTAAVYSLRAGPVPTVSTPLTWAEVQQCRRSEDLAFGPDEVLARVAAGGDLWGDLAAGR